MSAYAVKFELMPVFLLFLKTKNCDYGYRKLPSKPRKFFYTDEIRFQIRKSWIRHTGLC